MKILFDTSALIEIERKNQLMITLTKRIVANHLALISTITISEVLTGPYLRRDFKKSFTFAREVISQFQSIDFDPTMADKTAQYTAFMLRDGKPSQFQDAAIAATFIVTHSDFLLSMNRKHFEEIPGLTGKVQSPEGLAKII